MGVMFSKEAKKVSTIRSRGSCLFYRTLFYDNNFELVNFRLFKTDKSSLRRATPVTITEPLGFVDQWVRSHEAKETLYMKCNSIFLHLILKGKNMIVEICEKTF
jgi:hypothetical protein